MDFHCLKRKELQSLCKKNNVPANITNAAMADSLSSLPFVEGLEEFMERLEVKGSESPERSVITSPTLHRTAARGQVTKEVVEEGSKATRTRCGTRRRGLEVTDTRKTPATRTTRNKVAQEASVQKKTDKDMQAEFEADMESEAYETTVLSGVGEEVSEDVSTVSAEQEVQSKNEAPNAVLEIVNEGQETITVDDVNENLEVEADGGIDEEIEEPAEVMNASQKLDFHILGRKDLQSLCKKNKLPANTSNATMASGLESLEIVIGLEEFIKDYDPEAPLSPEMSEMKSCVRRNCSGRKATKEPKSSKLMTKSSRGTRTRVMGEIEEAKNIVSEIPAARSTRRKAVQIGSALCKETVQRKEMQTYTRREALRSVALEMENSTNAGADEGSLPMVEVEKELQCQLEAVNLEKAAVLDCDPRSSIGDGTDGILETENLKQQQESIAENYSNADVDVDDSEVTEQLGSMVNETEDDSGLPGQLEGLVEEKDDSVDGSADISVIVEDVNAEGLQVTAQSGDIVIEIEKDSEIFKEVDERANNVDMSAHISEVPEQPKDLVNQTEGAKGITSAVLQEFLDIPKELGDLVDERDDNVDMNQTEKIVGITSAELPEVFEQTAKRTDENVDEGTNACSEVSDESEGSHEGDQSLEEFEFGLITQHDKSLTMDENVDEDTDSCSEVSEESEDCHKEDQSLEEFDSGSITQDDEPITSDENVESEYGISPVEEQVTIDSDAYVYPVEDEDEKQQKFVSELPAEAEPALAVEKNLERESENTQNENSEAFAREKMTVKFDESLILADQSAHKEQDTPLCNKSMRKLKKMLKEKLEAMISLPKEMEKLTLEESSITLAKAEEEEQKQSETNELASMNSKSGIDNAPVSTVITQDVGEDSDDETICSESDNASSLLRVDILLDNELTSKDSISGQSGQIVVESVTPSKSASKPWKPLLLTTPSKSSSRTPLHSDVNKENVDQSASKTEPGKINMTVAGSGKLLSAMSMGKLKKEFKNLKQSEEKRHALQARSENCCPLASP